MQILKLDRSSQARCSALVSVVAAALLVGCADEGQGLTDPSPEGSAGTHAGGTKNTAGAAGSSEGGQDVVDNGGAAGTGDDEPRGGSEVGGTPGVAGSAGSGGTSEPEAGAGGEGGGGGEGGVHIAPACAFHSDPAPAMGGTGGVGPDPEPPSITVQLNAFVGSYLADAAGRSLYTYGADLPGDCNTPPQSLCVADCLVSWPPFDAGARVLPATLTDAGFGTIQRGDGGYQTTYMGWPLYYYKSDLTLGQVTGQGKGKIWHLAEVTLPSVTIMKLGAVKYLADGAGRTLYVSAADQTGTADSDPVSNCAGECLATFAGFREKNLSVVSSLDPLDFSVFVRQGAGGLQLAYKGMPLYRAATDLKSGDMNGTAVTGFTAALP